MQWTNTNKGYGIIARLFHGVMSVMLILQLGIGIWMVSLPNEMKSSIYGNHKTAGLILLSLVGMRLLWRMGNKLPELLNTPKWQIFAARSLHRSFYIMMIILPVTGWMMSTAAGYLPSFPALGKVAFPFFTQEGFCVLGQCTDTKVIGSMMHDGHMILGWLMVIMITVHISIAVYHLYLKDGIFERIFLDRT